MLERYKTFQPKPNTIDELKKVSQTIWDDLPQNSINKAGALSKDFELV